MKTQDTILGIPVTYDRRARIFETNLPHAKTVEINSILDDRRFLQQDIWKGVEPPPLPDLKPYKPAYLNFYATESWMNKK